MSHNDGTQRTIQFSYMLMKRMNCLPLFDSVMMAILWTGDSHMDFMMMEMWYLHKKIQTMKKPCPAGTYTCKVNISPSCYLIVNLSQNSLLDPVCSTSVQKRMREEGRNSSQMRCDMILAVCTSNNLFTLLIFILMFSWYDTRILKGSIPPPHPHL